MRACCGQAHARQTALQHEYNELKRANAERLKSCTRTVDKATEAAAAAAESVRLKRAEQHRTQQRIEETARELADAPATDRSLAEVCGTAPRQTQISAERTRPCLRCRPKRG
jgi:hypothetical protein